MSKRRHNNWNKQADVTPPPVPNPPADIPAAIAPQLITPPRYESTLLWGSFGTSVALIGLVLADQELRWLLPIAWPFFVAALWVLLKPLGSRKKKAGMVAASIAIAGGLAAWYWSIIPDRGFKGRFVTIATHVANHAGVRSSTIVFAVLQIINTGKLPSSITGFALDVTLPGSDKPIRADLLGLRPDLMPPGSTPEMIHYGSLELSTQLKPVQVAETISGYLLFGIGIPPNVLNSKGTVLSFSFWDVKGNKFTLNNIRDGTINDAPFFIPTTP